jgi:glycine/D-amino acid oxidase-like deaminating enzyme
MLVGATHEYPFSSPNPSEEGKNQLLQKFISIFPNQSFHVVDHKSGVRLTTPNRRPIMGLESYWDNRIGFFCGLGTKGLLYAPTCAKLFSHFLLDHQEIPAEFQLERFPLIKRN